jgi:hypothetical protein
MVVTLVLAGAGSFHEYLYTVNSSVNDDFGWFWYICPCSPSFRGWITFLTMFVQCEELSFHDTLRCAINQEQTAQPTRWSLMPPAMARTTARWSTTVPGIRVRCAVVMVDMFSLVNCHSFC